MGCLHGYLGHPPSDLFTLLAFWADVCKAWNFKSKTNPHHRDQGSAHTKRGQARNWSVPTRIQNFLAHICNVTQQYQAKVPVTRIYTYVLATHRDDESKSKSMGRDQPIGQPCTSLVWRGRATPSSLSHRIATAQVWLQKGQATSMYHNLYIPVQFQRDAPN